MESIINKKSEEVYNKYFENQKDPAVDPYTLLMIAKILVEVGIYIYNCRNGKDKRHVLALMRRPGIGHIFAVAKIVNKHTEGTDINPKKLRNVILSMDFDEDNFNSLIKEVEKHVNI